MTTKRKATGVIKHTFRSAYNKGNEKYSHDFPNGITEQYHNDSCDINQILAQFMETGIMPPTNQRTPNYMDVSEIDFQTMQNQLANAKSLFEQLPEHVKANFDNEPFKFLQFAENPQNAQALHDMGLANAPKNEPLAQSLETQSDEKTTSLAEGKPDDSGAAAELST